MLYRLLCAGFILLLIPLSAQAQDSRFLSLQDVQYDYISHLQDRGYLLELNPTVQPYTAGEVRGALEGVDTDELSPVEKRWHDALFEAVERETRELGRFEVGGALTAGARRSSSARLSALNPQGDATTPALSHARLRAFAAAGDWVGQVGVTHDLFFEEDPDGLDVGRRLRARSGDAYLGYHGDLVGVTVGRFDNHWSRHGQAGMMLSDNPHPFDQIRFRFGGSTLAFQSIIGDLNSMAAMDDPSPSYGGDSIRRFLIGHRLDWRVSSSLRLYAMEGEIRYGEGASLSLRSLVPHAGVLNSHNTPRINDLTFMVGAGGWYQAGPVTVHLQGVLEDILLRSTFSSDRRERRIEAGEYYPPMINATASATWAGVTDRTDLHVEVDVVGSNAYQTEDYPDRWAFAGRGLATNFNDYVRVGASAVRHTSLLEGLELEPGLTFYYKGASDLRGLRDRQLGGETVPFVLSGTVERTLRPSLELRYRPGGMDLGSEGSPRLNVWVDADMGVNFIRNAGHEEGATDRRFVGVFEVFAQLQF